MMLASNVYILLSRCADVVKCVENSLGSKSSPVPVKRA